MSFKWVISITFTPGKVLYSDCHISGEYSYFSHYPLCIVIDQCNMPGKSMSQFSSTLYIDTRYCCSLHPGYSILHNFILKILTPVGLKIPLESFQHPGLLSKINWLSKGYPSTPGSPVRTQL